jgi:AmiR/NasT family two-component response regulator
MQPSGRAEWRDFRVVVAHPYDQSGSALLRFLRRLDCRITHAWPAPERLGEPADLLFCALDRQVLPLASSLLGEPRPAIVAVLADDTGDLAKLISSIGPHAILAKPFEDGAVLASMVLARANSGYQQRLLARIAKLEETLRSMRKVERAKAILMEKRHLDESEAYELLRKQAMNKRVPIGLVASAIIDANEVLQND